MRTFCAELLAVILLAVVSCGRKEDIPDPVPEPVLRSVTVQQESVVLSDDGSFDLPFIVKDPDFVFTELHLLTESGEEPEEFCILRFTPSAEAGGYTAVLQDAGHRKKYNRQVCLAIPQRNAETGVESFVTSAYFQVSSERQGPETGLSVVFIDTENGQEIVSKTDYLPAQIRIFGEGGYESLPSVSCSVRGRGNTTWWWPKKPYLIKLDQKTSVLGMPKHKRWVLLANFMDRTLMRNLVSMKVASLTGLDWTPRCVPVELVLNGKHVGTYLLIEQVRVDKNRVPVSEQDGYLLECDFHYDNEVQWIDPHGYNGQWGIGVPFGVKYPEPEDITQEQLTYIRQFVSETADVLYGDNFADPENGYAKYIDTDSFIDYWLVFEVMCNHELGNPGSVYMHMNRGGKLTAGPCWDFDWGVLSFYTSAGETRLVNDKAIWYERLFRDSAFAERVKARFEELLPQLQTIPDYMDQCEALLTESARLNFQMWNPADDKSQNGGKIINGDENLSFHDAVKRLKDNYKRHLQVMAEKL